MRVLCVHGWGANAQISRAQCAPLRQALKRAGHNDVFFEYLEGRIEAAPFPGLSDIYTPPFYGFWEENNPESIVRETGRIRSVLEDDGPFDGVFGISEGAAALLTAMFLAKKAQVSLGVKFMVLVAPMSPFDQEGQRRLDRSMTGGAVFDVPAIVIKGREDPIRLLIKLVQGLFSEGKTTVVRWSGGHSMPNSGEKEVWEQTAKEIVHIVEK